jgi:putative ABC transport system ATP-binding protein
MNEFMVNATGVKKSYSLGNRTLDVLRGIDLTVERGEFVALRGSSGAGKSTLLHLLGGLDRLDGGRVIVDGRSIGDLSAPSLTQFRRLHVGFIFQSYHLLPELDAVENVALPARMARMPAKEAEKRAIDLLGSVGLADRLEHRPRELSGGEQQRVALARSLVNRPPLILADEPTGNLDSRTGEEVLSLLLRLRDEYSVTLIIATHDGNVAARAERTVNLRDGVVAGPSDPP